MKEEEKERGKARGCWEYDKNNGIPFPSLKMSSFYVGSNAKEEEYELGEKGKEGSRLRLRFCSAQLSSIVRVKPPPWTRRQSRAEGGIGQSSNMSTADFYFHFPLYFLMMIMIPLDGSIATFSRST
ncbi:hypothetical protein CRG98_007012 [Punica granatum]|uniref:Uncharacterized protein n=1 Tax=Punica granatum TaxID=22663 RepID=A0A2I0KVY1_PUNGR|nr:hypothetical protein CRG98_007012 [Punica granatum]